MGRKTIETLEQGFLSFVFGQKIKVCRRLKNICKSTKNRKEISYLTFWDIQ